MPTEYDGYTLDKWGYVTDLGKFEGEHFMDDVIEAANVEAGIAHD